MANGTTKPISEIEVGDHVLTMKPETGELSSRAVIDTSVMVHEGDLLDIALKDYNEAGVIKTTDEHKFWSVADRSWVPATRLEEGDKLRQVDGAVATVTEVGERGGQNYMFDLTVEVEHNFFVAADEDGRSLSALVHNDNCIRNGHLAGRSHPKTGVPFDSDGFPDFSASLHPDVPEVRIEVSGNRSTDLRRANEAAGLSRTPSGYVWHHNQDPGLMQLVERDVHTRTGHTGGYSLGS